MNVIVIKKFNGYVANYNEAEGSCDWVVNLKAAAKFSNMIAASRAAVILDLEDFNFVDVPAKDPGTKSMRRMFRF